MIKKVLTWGGIAFLIFFIMYRPSMAADVFAGIGHTIAGIGQGFGDFFRDLIS